MFVTARGRSVTSNLLPWSSTFLQHAAPAPVVEDIAPALTVECAASETTKTALGTVFSQPTATDPIASAAVLPTTYGALPTTYGAVPFRRAKRPLFVL